MKKITKKIFFMSRFTGPNTGNEALSLEFRDLFKNFFEENCVRSTDRYPKFLQSVRFSDLNKNNLNHVEAFEKVASTIISKYSVGGKLPNFLSTEVIRVDKASTKRKKFEFLYNLKRKISIRYRLSKFGIISKASIKDYIFGCKWSDYFIWNPAGEVHAKGDKDEAVRFLLSIRIAQLLGAKTIIVNQSLELKDNELINLFKHVYQKCEKLVFRDESSVNIAKQMECLTTNIKLIGDMVFNSVNRQVIKKVNQIEAEKNSIVLTINGKSFTDFDAQWQSLFEFLNSLNRKIYFFSNAIVHDYNFAVIANKYGFHVINEQLDYNDTLLFLENVDIVITTRIHMAIMGLSKGCCVIAVEPNDFKLTDMIKSIDYSINCINTNKSDNWSSEVIKNINYSLENIEKLKAEGIAKAKIKSSKSKKSYEELIQLM